MLTNVNSTNSQDQPIQYLWVTFTDDSKEKVNSIVHELEPNNPEAFLIPVNDPRVLQFMYPPKIKAKVVKWRVNNLEQLNLLATYSETILPRPIYRGQSDYRWSLETKLERNVPEFVKKEVGLERYEYQLLTEAKRRLHHYLNTLPDEEDLLSWLALLRHHGVPTRVLDVTKSIFIACHFALRDTPNNQDAALWIFPRHQIESSSSDFSHALREEDIRCSPFTVGQYNEKYDWPFPKSMMQSKRSITYESLKIWPDAPHLNFVAILEAAMLGLIEKPGIAIAEPFWLPKRMDVQQGAFLIPFNVRQSFEENIFSFLSLEPDQDLNSDVDETDFPDSQDLAHIIRKRLLLDPVIKVRLCNQMHDSLRKRLTSMNIRDLTLFPDIDGAMDHISSQIPIERK